MTQNCVLTSRSQIRANLEAEASVIGAVLIDPPSFAVASEKILGPNYFYSQKHRLIWGAIMQLALDGEPMDIITVADKLVSEIRDGKIAISEISAFCDNVVTAAGCAAHAEIVAEEYRAREIIRAYSRGIDALNEFSTSRTVWEKTAESTAGIFHLEEAHYSVEVLEKKLSEPRPFWGCYWGIPALDSEVGQYPRGAIIIIGGRPGHMKSTLALQMIDALALVGEKVFFQSMEMTREENDLRRLARFSKVPLWQIKQGGRDIRAAVEEIKAREKHVVVSEAAGLTPEEVALNIRIAHDRHGITFFFLDHFHRLSFTGSRELRHAQEAGLELIISTCKNKGITPVILAQLNRGIENYESEREPRLSDLRECGRLEEAATNVLLLWWNYKKTQNECDKYEIKVLNSKARDGKTGRVFMRLDPEIYTFGNLILKEGKS